jgi:hypothetical protein
MITEDTSTITRPSLDEAYGSLTWYDEQSIKKNLGDDVHDLMEALATETASLSQVVALVRAFEFIAAQRDGAKEPAALNTVRKLTAKQIDEIADAYLATEDEVSPDEPVTEAGKDDFDSE